MKIYKVKVNGKFYEVILEEVSEAPGEISTAKDTPVDEENIVKSPMQGLILDIIAKVGKSVNKGDTLIILEAMKMENEILSPKTGIVKNIHVNKGQTVNLNDLLVEIE